MMHITTKIFTLLIIISLGMGCKKSNLERADDAVFENNLTNKFEKLIMLINIQNNNENFIVVEQLDSVEVYINTTLLGKFNSSMVNTEFIDVQTEGDYEVSNQPLSYLIEAEPNTEDIIIDTAGGYSDFLNDYYEIVPGDYVCLIKSLSLYDINQDTTIFYPYKYVNFTVEENSTSVYIGEITIEI